MPEDTEIIRGVRAYIMNKNFKRITKLLLITGCVSVIANYAGNAAPLSYDLNQNAPAVRTNYTTPNKIRLEGDVHFDDHGQLINLSLRLLKC